jgi:cell division protein FtsI/penicillin-binding protein 2
MGRKIYKDVFNLRTTVLTVVLFVFFVAILVRFFKLQILQGSNLKKTAQSQYVAIKKLFPSRGEIRILDKDSVGGYIIATNIKNFFVYATPPRISDLQKTSKDLGRVLDMKEKEIFDKISIPGKKYVVIKKQITAEQQQKLSELKIDGIYLDVEEARFYPEKSFLSHTLGFVGYKNDKKTGLYGLERYFELDLAGKSGILNEEKDLSGAWIFGGRRDIVPAVDGVSLFLTIDKSIQFKVESAIKEAVKRHGADSGSVVVVDPKTGDILAMAGYPDFDLNEFNKVTDHGIFNNEIVNGSYEPGSIFKPIVMAAGIEEGKVAPNSTFFDPGFIVVDGYKIKNSDSKSHGTQTMIQVLEESLNTGAIFVKDQIGNEKFLDYVKKFGFGKSTGVELLESKGDLKGLDGNIQVNFHTASFGQGILVTPIQMIQAYTALANKGVMKSPHLLNSKVLENGQMQKNVPESERRVISTRTAELVTSMLVSVVENGHGKRAGVKGYKIAGKTGTAQVAKKNGRGYDETNNIGSFIGYGPADDPKFLMLVRINHPRDVKFAESTAAPAFGEIAEFILNYLQIPPKK